MPFKLAKIYYKLKEYYQLFLGTLLLIDVILIIVMIPMGDPFYAIVFYSTLFLFANLIVGVVFKELKNK